MHYVILKKALDYDPVVLKPRGFDVSEGKQKELKKLKRQGSKELEGVWEVGPFVRRSKKGKLSSVKEHSRRRTDEPQRAPKENSEKRPETSEDIKRRMTFIGRGFGGTSVRGIKKSNKE
jgi:hypothetical protein